MNSHRFPLELVASSDGQNAYARSGSYKWKDVYDIFQHILRQMLIFVLLKTINELSKEEFVWGRSCDSAECQGRLASDILHVF